MTNILIMGNSHVACLKQGWDTIKSQHPDVTLEFFALPYKRFDTLHVDADLNLCVREDLLDEPMRETAEAINGRSSVNLAGFDHIVWAGYRTALPKISKLLDALDVHNLRVTGAAPLVSRRFFETLCGEIADTLAIDEKWANLPRENLVLYPIAAPDERARSDEESARGPWQRLAEHPDGVRDAKNLFYAIWQEKLAQEGVSVLLQPEETETPLGLTKLEYSEGAERLGGGNQNDTDLGHMNSKFGAASLQKLLATFVPSAA